MSVSVTPSPLNVSPPCPDAAPLVNEFGTCRYGTVPSYNRLGGPAVIIFMFHVGLAAQSVGDAPPAPYTTLPVKGINKYELVFDGTFVFFIVKFVPFVAIVNDEGKLLVYEFTVQPDGGVPDGTLYVI